MQIITLSKKDINYKEYVKRRALESDYETLITEDTIIKNEDGETVIVYVSIPSDASNNARVACKKIKYEKGQRTAGLVTESRIFGYSPRNTIRKDYCSATRLAYEQPLEHTVITSLGLEISKLYEKYLPQKYKEHSDKVDKDFSLDWRITNTPFTSGIVNKNNPLNYHFDTGNIKNMYSNMIVFKKGVEGGYLSCPEYNVAFEVADNTLIFFDGQKILHGVTPIKKVHPKGYRYSIVYYTLHHIWNCSPINEEIARYRNVRAKREKNRIEGVNSKEDLAS